MTPNALFNPPTETKKRVILKTVHQRSSEESSITASLSRQITRKEGVPPGVSMQFIDSSPCYERSFAPADAGLWMTETGAVRDSGNQTAKY